MNLVSDVVFSWIVTGLTAGVAGIWLIYDALKLWRLRRANGGDPIVHDQRFGYVIGILVMTIGVVGCMRYHGVF